MSLRELAPTIISEIIENGAYLRKQNMLFRAYNGNLEPLLEERLAEVHSPSMRNNMRVHATLPNYFQKSVRCISGIYNFEIDRKFSENQDVFDWYIKDLNFNEMMNQNNEVNNAVKGALNESFFNKKLGRLRLRNEPIDRYWPYSTDPLNPTDAEVIVKMLGNIQLSVEEKKSYTEAQCYILYSADEVVKINCYKKHDKSLDIKVQGDNDDDSNPLEFLPMVHVNQDNYNIIPELDSSSFSLAIGPGFDLTGASVASYFQSFPIRYIINGPEDLPADLSINPDDLVQLRGEEGSDQVPEFGELASTLDLSKVLELVKTKVEDFMYTRDCPVNKDASSDKAGIAIMLESADTLSNKKRQINAYKKSEQEIFNVIAQYHNWLLKNKLSELADDVPRKAFSGKRIKVEIDFQLPSVEAEQAQEARADEDQKAPEADSAKEE